MTNFIPLIFLKSLKKKKKRKVDFAFYLLVSAIDKQNDPTLKTYFKKLKREISLFFQDISHVHNYSILLQPILYEARFSDLCGLFCKC